MLGGLGFFGFNGVGYAPNPAYAPTIPHLAYMIFQAMFATITPALIIGAFVERIRFRTLVVFILLWATLVYDPIAHWVWKETIQNRVPASSGFEWPPLSLYIKQAVFIQYE